MEYYELHKNNLTKLLGLLKMGRETSLFSNSKKKKKKKKRKQRSSLFPTEWLSGREVLEQLYVKGFHSFSWCSR